MKRVLPALLLAALPNLSFAHDTWLLPDRWRVAVGEAQGFTLTSGMAFPAPETAVKADRLAARSLRLAGQKTALDPGASDRALHLSAGTKGEGVAVAWITTRERSLTLTPKQVEEYLAEIGATEAVGPAWKKSGQTAWRETYVKLAKTFVRVGGADDRSWAEPVGLALELVPTSDPTRLKVGDTLGLNLVSKGQPLPDFAVGVVPAPPAQARLLRTDAQGRLSVTLDRSGPLMFRVTLIRPSSARPGEWESAFTTLTLEVQAR